MPESTSKLSQFLHLEREKETTLSSVHHDHNLIRGSQRICSLKYMFHRRFFAGWETYGRSPTSVPRGRMEKLADQRPIFAALQQCNRIPKNYIDARYDYVDISLIFYREFYYDIGLLLFYREIFPFVIILSPGYVYMNSFAWMEPDWCVLRPSFLSIS